MVHQPLQRRLVDRQHAEVDQRSGTAPEDCFGQMFVADALLEQALPPDRGRERKRKPVAFLAARAQHPGDLGSGRCFRSVGGARRGGT